MKTLTLTEFRSEPGERVREVAREGASFLLTKSGRPVARLVPADDVTVIDAQGRVHGAAPLAAAVARSGSY